MQASTFIPHSSRIGLAGLPSVTPSASLYTAGDNSSGPSSFGRFTSASVFIHSLLCLATRHTTAITFLWNQSALLSVGHSSTQHVMLGDALKTATSCRGPQANIAIACIPRTKVTTSKHQMGRSARRVASEQLFERYLEGDLLRVKSVCLRQRDGSNMYVSCL